MTQTSPRPEWWTAYVEVLETVANALLALAVWAGIATVVAVLLAQATGEGWLHLLVLPVGALGAGLSVRARAVQLRERLSRGQSLPQ